MACLRCSQNLAAGLSAMDEMSTQRLIAKRGGVRLQPVRLCAALIVMLSIVAMSGLSAEAQRPNSIEIRRDSFVGIWFGEYSGLGTTEGLPYDAKKWVTSFRADGTQTITFRFYLGTKLQAVERWVGKWGARDNAFWTRCLRYTWQGHARTCSMVWHYDVHAIDARQMTYTNRESGVANNDALRAQDSFALGQSSLAEAGLVNPTFDSGPRANSASAIARASPVRRLPASAPAVAPDPPAGDSRW
jgi:hypothetical protein